MERFNAHVVEYLQHDRGWADANLEANHWFSLLDVQPAKAAMLLCNSNPNDPDLNDAEKCTKDETGPREFVQLEQRFTDLNKSEPRSRTLLDWVVAARQSELKYHSWINRYIEAVPKLAASLFPQANTQPQAALVVAAGVSGGVRPANAGPAWSIKTSMKRAPGYRSPLYKFLKAAQIAGQPCPKARDVLDAWTTKPPPDVQVMPDGVKYNDGLGNPKEANLKAIQQSIKNLMN